MSSEKNIDLRGTYKNTSNDASTPITNNSSKDNSKARNKNTDSSKNQEDSIGNYVSGDAQRSSSSHQFHKNSQE